MEVYSTVLWHLRKDTELSFLAQELVEVDRKLEFALRGTARLFPEIVDVHEIHVGRAGEHLYLSCHCTLPDDLVMHRVHLVITALEDRFKLECPEVDRVTIHPEPVTDNLR